SHPQRTDGDDCPSALDRTVGYPRCSAQGCTSRALFRRRDCFPTVRTKQKGADMPARVMTRKYLRWLLAAAVTVAMLVAVLTTVAGTGFAQSGAAAQYQYATGCPNDKATSPINVSEVSPPAHLLINRQAIAPS